MIEVSMNYLNLLIHSFIHSNGNSLTLNGQLTEPVENYYI